MRHQPGVKRRRPKLCEVCHRPATVALEYHRPTVTIRRDATVKRSIEVVRVFRCTEHAAG